MAGDLRPGLLRHRDDGRRRPALRPRPLRHGGLPRLAAPGRPDDRRRPGQPEDGPGAAPDLRPDGRAPSGSSRWASAPPAAACSTTTRSSRASTTSCRSTCTCPAARPGRRCSSTRSSSCTSKIQDDQARREPPQELETAGAGRPIASRRRDCEACCDERGASAGPRRAARRERMKRQRHLLPAEERPADKLAPATTVVASRPAPSDLDVVDVRRGMFGVARHRRHLRLRRPGPPGRAARRGRAGPTAAGSTRSPTRSSEALATALDDAIEKVVVDRGEMTFHVARERLLDVCQTLRDDADLRFELCLGVSGVHYPRRRAARAARGLPPALDDPQPPGPARGRLPRRRPAHPVASSRSTRPTTGTSARPTTSSASSSTATRR